MYKGHKEYQDGMANKTSMISGNNGFPIPNSENASQGSYHIKKKGCCS